ncbi:hypothetical protein AB0H76_34280 [Nocardia sp. NPDC050712]|uniref:hypothetical protein n=1 Tax=Nocardia sp. NPDC050712 TaxID=3155518 RepID=UPI0033C337AB
MTLACREWAGPLGAETKSGAYDRLLELKNTLTPILDRYPSARFRARGYFSTVDMENDLLVPGQLLSAAGALPVLWLNITYEHPDLPADALLEVERQFGLRLLGEFMAES